MAVGRRSGVGRPVVIAPVRGEGGTLQTVSLEWSCRFHLLGGSDPQEVTPTISEAEAAACKAEIATAVANPGC